MRVNANGTKYDVRWSRVRRDEDGKIVKKGENKKGENRKVVSVNTNCSISEVDETKTGAAKYTSLAIKTAFLSKKDADDRRVGRKVAFTKVLNSLFPTCLLMEFSEEEAAEKETTMSINNKMRTIRKDFWETYKENYNL